MHDHAYTLASSPARAKNGEAPGTHCLRMHLISPRYGDSGLFSDSSMLCDVRVRTRYSILVRIIQWRVMKVQITAQLDLLNFVRSIIAISKLSTLYLHLTHLRFSKPSSSFNVISNRALILDASLSWLAFLPNNAILWWL